MIKRLSDSEDAIIEAINSGRKGNKRDGRDGTLISASPEYMRDHIYVARKAEDEMLRQVKEWGEESCPHHDVEAEQRNYDFRHECPECWQELKQQVEGEE